MEQCAQCKKIRSRGAQWETYVARYHEVEIQHSVCPQCSVLSFPKFYRLYEKMADNNTNIKNDSLGMKNYLIAKFNKHLT
jgi:hypothetical protein